MNSDMETVANSANVKKQRIVLTGGGTGGHLYPALALAEGLKSQPDVEALLYIGNASSLESKKVPEAGFNFEAVPFRGMPRGKNPFKLLGWLWALNQAIKQAKQKLIAFNATAVIGTGGYVAAPVLAAAQQLKIPYFIHEPDAVPGLVNKLMAKTAVSVTGAFPNRAKGLGITEDRYTFTGNPLRGNFSSLSKQDALQQLELTEWATEKPVLVIVGGSQGARTLNMAVVKALPQLIDDCNLQVIHQCGDKLWDETQALYQEQSTKVWEAGMAEKIVQAYHCKPFFDGMDALWAVADLAVCRAGSLTLSELYLSGTPALLVPYPYAAANHQEANARLSEVEGASVLLLDADCTPETIVSCVQKLLENSAQLATMKANALRLAKPNATQTIITKIMDCLSNQ
ncbi:MAG: undecaprenyldiphospho-muramoylpentapeptide beta-N-acetylglucosaminyltransferase [Vampirovibrio sp.]|nr:undecaprenyldiphospho-muramoylpentapeptide beta-N-acetylglucosaminyltransferase [Vampirovibrio sp.]